MDTVRLGSTGITVNQNGFGALPIQRVTVDEAVRLLIKAFEHGITYFDTARGYTDSEEKLGLAFEGDTRKNLYIATKTTAQNADAFWRDLETSLKFLKTEYIDVYQFHNPPFCPKPKEADGLYDAMLKAKEQGMIHHIGITNHRLSVAREAIASGLYEILQFPFSYLASGKDIEIVKACEQANMGFVAMKALSGGLITNASAAYAYIAQYPNVLPIWGVQRDKELDEFIAMMDNPPRLTADIEMLIEKEREALSGSFCRGCGYCMPCPAGIEINTCARMTLLLRRSPSAQWFNEKNQAMMKKISDCQHCGHCEKRCPYGLKTQKLLQDNDQDFREILAGKPM